MKCSIPVIAETTSRDITGNSRWEGGDGQRAQRDRSTSPARHGDAVPSRDTFISAFRFFLAVRISVSKCPIGPVEVGLPIGGQAVEHDFNDFSASDPRRHKLPAVVKLDYGAADQQAEDLRRRGLARGTLRQSLPFGVRLGAARAAHGHCAGHARGRTRRGGPGR